MFSQALIRWYRKAHRKLPWRETRDPYRIWVSEVMLQQTQVRTVLPYYDRFLALFPTVESLAEADPDQVLKSWEGLGYYARARNLHRAARMVVDDYSGRIPDTVDEFKKLPGVGSYIGAAVQSIVFGHPQAVVDGNVKRVLARLLCLDTPVNASNAHRLFEPHAQHLLGENDPASFNQAIMELGALICTPKKPNCDGCPVTEFCQAFKEKRIHEFPRRIQSKKTPLYPISVGIINKNGRLLITKRKPEGLLGGLWEFPGGKIQKGETAEKACLREIEEETGIHARVDQQLATISHAYTHFKIKMDVFLCSWVSGRVRLNGPVDHQWIRLGRIHEFAFPKANLKFIPLIPKLAPNVQAGWNSVDRNKNKRNPV